MSLQELTKFLIEQRDNSKKTTKNWKFKFKTRDKLTNAFKAGFTFINVWAVDLLNLYLNKQKAPK